MTANIIHDPNGHRSNILKKELHRQKWVPEIRLFDPLYHSNVKTAISLAHKQIVEHAKAQGLHMVWIIEDDVRFPSIYGMEYFIEQIPDDFDLYLGGISSGVINGSEVVKISGLHCYVVHERFYDAFLRADESHHLDYALSKIGGVFKVCYPLAAIQHNGFSENTGKVENYDKLFKNYKIYGL